MEDEVGGLQRKSILTRKNRGRIGDTYILFEKISGGRLGVKKKKQSC